MNRLMAVICWALMVGVVAAAMGVLATWMVVAGSSPREITWTIAAVCGLFAGIAGYQALAAWKSNRNGFRLPRMHSPRVVP